MRRYLPSTIHRYLDLPSTQRTQTHISQRHYTNPPDPGPSTYPLPTYTTHTTSTPTHTHLQHSPCSHRIGKSQTQSSHPFTPSPPTQPRAKHIHISHTSPTPLIPRTTLIHSTSAALDTIPEPRAPPTYPSLTTTTSHPSPTPAFPSPSHPHTLSAYTHVTQTTVHASQSQQPPHPHRAPRQRHRHTKNGHMTTDTPQGHRPISRSGRNLIILHVNINGIKNKLEELKLLIHDTHAVIITIQETKLTPKTNNLTVHNLTIVRANRLHKAGGGLITLIRDNITFTTTDIPSTINTHNTELQMVKIHINNTKHITIANMYIPHRDNTTKQLTRAYTTAYSTSQTYHTQSSPEM